MALDLDTYIELEANCFPPGIPFFALVISKCGRSILVQIKIYLLNVCTYRWVPR